MDSHYLWKWCISVYVDPLPYVFDVMEDSNFVIPLQFFAKWVFVLIYLDFLSFQLAFMFQMLQRRKEQEETVTVSWYEQLQATAFLQQFVQPSINKAEEIKLKYTLHKAKDRALWIMWCFSEGGFFFLEARHVSGVSIRDYVNLTHGCQWISWLTSFSPDSNAVWYI